MTRIEQQIGFLLEIDKLKEIRRRNLTINGRRHESDAEHSWHVAMMAVILAEHANAPHLDLFRLVKMLLVHDLVEIDAGDTFAYDTSGMATQHDREVLAADRIFPLLPADQAAELRALWDEFEAMETPESKFARAIDRVLPLLLNASTDGAAWKEHGITADRVRARNRHAAEGSAALWAHAEKVIAGAIAAGALLPDRDEPFLPASDPRVAVMGRADRSTPGLIRFGYPGVTVRVCFEGTGLTLRAQSSSAGSRLAVKIDGGESHVLTLQCEVGDLVLAQELSAGSHSVDLVHLTETWVGIVTLHGFGVASGSRWLDPPRWPSRRLLFVGDSVTSGEGAGRWVDENPERLAGMNSEYSYGMLIARELHAQCHLVSYGGRGLIRDWEGRRDVLNAPEFFDLAIADSAAKVPWSHADYVPDGVIVSLGTNDFNLQLGELPPREEFSSSYLAFLGSIRLRYPLAHIFLTEGAVVNDQADPERPQKTVLREIISDVVSRFHDPKVHAVPAAHYPGDSYDPHPTREQHAAIADDLVPVIRREIGW